MTDNHKGPIGGVNQNWQHELNVANRILEMRMADLRLRREIIKVEEQQLRLNLESIQHIKRRIYELESHGNDH